MVYFLAPDEIESVPSSSRLDSSLKLMKSFCGTANYHDYLIKDGKKLIFYEIGRHNPAKISSVIYTNDGTVSGYENDFLRGKSNSGWPRRFIFTFKVLPSIGIVKTKNTGFKLSFKGVPGHSYQPAVPDHVLKFDKDVRLNALRSAGSYVVISGCVYQNRSLWNKISQWRDNLVGRFRKSWDMFVVLEVQQQNSSYNVVELCRKKTEEYVEGKDSIVYDMAIDGNQERLFFCISSELEIGIIRFDDILVYNVKSGIVEDLINFSSYRDGELLKVYVFSHPKYEECIFAITRSKLIIFSRNDIGRYQIFRTESHIQSAYQKSIFKNRNNQILVCYQVTNGVKIKKDVFDSSNEVVIGYSSTIFPLNYSINFNESGEEIYICENGTLKIYVYKSYLETLLLLSAAVVSRTYSLSQLTEMKLPKHLYKYL